MAETEYSTTARLPVETVWDFVKEMDNWAHFLTGYQQHEKENEFDSVWTLKGDLGVLARTLKLRVHVTEWNGPSAVRFELTGLNEQMQGGGALELAAGEAQAAPVPAKGFLRRALESIFRFFFQLRHGVVERDPAARKGSGPGTTRLTFRLRIDPGGPMAPMVDAMIQPVMLTAAEDLANKIMAHLEAQHGTGN